ncbi:MAG: transcriptional regulator [Deltaproteobacteria bacterium RBG_16_71_12]|nr:MAG: transcriptional regulator [Deltaproteobacteria bacterium RBG_16_71_12]
MRGYLRDIVDEETGVGTLRPWEALVVDAVGNLIEFWNFKRNQGRVWALLYLRGRALTAAQIQAALGLSKGAVSMLVRELEQWSVVVRVRSPHDDAWRFAAETELMKMIGRVISERERGMVASVREDLERAERAARDDGDVPREVLDRLRRMRTLAVFVEKALKVFVDTARFDAIGVLDVLRDKTNRN